VVRTLRPGYVCKDARMSRSLLVLTHLGETGLHEYCTNPSRAWRTYDVADWAATALTPADSDHRPFAGAHPGTSHVADVPTAQRSRRTIAATAGSHS
jgi:hypothetical protein